MHFLPLCGKLALLYARSAWLGSSLEQIAYSAKVDMQSTKLENGELAQEGYFHPQIGLSCHQHARC